MNTSLARLFGITALCSALQLIAGTAEAQVRPSIAALQAEIATLQSQVATGTIPNVGGYVTMDISTPGKPVLRVSGANVQVVNGLGSTASVNSLGNLIVGYDEVRPGTVAPECSLGYYYNTQTICTNNGGTWQINHKGGSHNLVIGPKHNYVRFAGFVTGEQNTINGDWASVSGGKSNTASGAGSSVSGGEGNASAGQRSSVSGGYLRVTGGNQSWAAGNLYQQY